MKKVFSVLLLLAAAGAVHAAAQVTSAPREIRSEYRITYSGLAIGRVNESFSRKGDTYSIHSVTRSEGPLKVVLDEEITLESTGRVEAEGLVPLTFGQRRAGKPDRDLKASFDWSQGVMRSSYRGDRIEVPLPAHTQDRLSLMYQFKNLAAAKSERVSVSMSNGRKVEQYTYRLVEEERITTPAGEFDTLHYARVTSGKEARADVWLAKDRFSFPVRVVFDDPRGMRLEQTLVALEARP